MLMRAPSAHHRPAAVKSMLTISAATLGATLIVAATAGGTYGLWADSAPVSAGIVNSGSLTLLVNDGPTATLDSTRMAAMFPGDRVQYQVTVTNSGTVSADVTMAATSSSAAKVDYTVEVVGASCPDGSVPQLDAPDLLAGSTTFDTLTAGQSVEACIEVTLKPNASNQSNGAMVPFTITFNAVQRSST